MCILVGTVTTTKLPSTTLLVAVALSAACRTAPVAGGGSTGGSAGDPRPPIVQPGAPGQASQVITADKAADLSRVQFTPADVKFMQEMIGHHAQALEMVELLKTHSASEDMKKLGLRIELSQEDEIRMMEGWLEARRQEVPMRHGAHMHDPKTMPGMLSPEEMERLAQAKGAEFDRLFLEGMIKHHGGALTMVEALLAMPGAAQESEVFAFVSDVEADQKMEIDRMGAMLAMIKERQQ